MFLAEQWHYVLRFPENADVVHDMKWNEHLSKQSICISIEIERIDRSDKTWLPKKRRTKFASILIFWKLKLISTSTFEPSKSSKLDQYFWGESKVYKCRRQEKTKSIDDLNMKLYFSRFNRNFLLRRRGSYLFQARGDSFLIIIAIHDHHDYHGFDHLHS